ncbi:MAG TPA: hypothetical protein EYP56_10995 [Planctomycetaceae bacterium]|nr:hypothetical protein [Planctomycetaceae bacterium]
MDQVLRQVRRARWRIGLGRFLRALGWCWFAALMLALIPVVVDKFRPLGVSVWVWPAGALVLGWIAAAGWALLKDRGPLDAAIEIDRRFGLKERVSSVLAISGEARSSEWGRALVEDAVRRVQRIDVRDGIPLRPGRQIFLPLVPAVLLAVVGLLISPAVMEKTSQASAGQEVAKQVRRSAERLRRKLVEQRRKAAEKGLKEAQDLFHKLAQGTEQLAEKPINERKQALMELNDLKRQIEKRRQDLEGAQRLRDQLRSLKDMPRGPADRLLEQIRRGNFQQAKEELEKLKEALQKGDLAAEEREKLAQQLEQMKEKLQEMTDAHRKAMEDLQQRIDQARAEGRQDEANKLEEMLDALRQQLPQMNQLNQLADQMGQCARALQDGNLQDASQMLDTLSSQLDSLQTQLDELELLDDAMVQLTQCRDQMNCAACGGAGCHQCQLGMGMGKGRGAGPRPEEEDKVGFYDTKSPVQVQKGEATVVGNAGWSALRGDVREQIQQQYESTRRADADPLTGLRLPRRMRQSVQQYFDDFRERDR